jgi:hypothetical protein
MGGFRRYPELREKAAEHCWDTTRRPDGVSSPSEEETSRRSCSGWAVLLGGPCSVNARRFLFGTYTHRCKSYVDREFYSSLRRTVDNERRDVYHTVDNSPSGRYARSLSRRYGDFSNFEHLEIAAQSSSRATFLNNVAVSANRLREVLLESDCDHLVTIESDVLVPPNLPVLFEEALDCLQSMEVTWGAVGGLYYGFHHPELRDRRDNRLLQSDQVFSGCTCYNRRLLEESAFRWSPEDPGPFPDSWMKHDAHALGFSTWLYNKIKCRHVRGRWIRFYWSRFQ